MVKKASSNWLIIFLAAIIFLLGWVVFSNKHSQEIEQLNKEIEKLNQELKKTPEKQKVTTPSEFESISPTQSSTPSSSLEPEAATQSGVKE